VAVEDADSAHCPNGGTAIHLGIDQDGNGVLDEAEIVNTSYACDGEGGHSALVLPSDEPAGTNCPYGGTRYDSGADLNDNGILDESEITDTSYVCDGIPGRDTLMSFEDEPAGDNCPYGGYKLLSGLDTDHDSLLDPDEVTDTRYLCNGADGHDSLIRQSDEAPGTNCEFGGKRVDTGPDMDDNGTLDDSEVTWTQYICNGTQGDPGHAWLVDSEEFTSDSTCPEGGVRYRGGLDMDDSGTLDAGEVSDSREICHGSSKLVRMHAAQWGGVCRYGGAVLDQGIDMDADGVLDDSEVTETEYVCREVVVQIAAGALHTCVVKSDGSAWCWGYNLYGRLGDNSTTDRHTPVHVSGMSSGVSQISAGAEHTCAVKSDGSAWCWGYNQDGRLGDGTTTARHAPVVIW